MDTGNSKQWHMMSDTGRLVGRIDDLRIAVP